MTDAVKEKLKIAKRKNLQKSLRPETPLTQVDNEGETHIVFTPAPQSEQQDKPNFSEAFQSIRHHFKTYTARAASRLGRYFPDEKLQRLGQYLDKALEDFEKSATRFMQNTKNTDYKLDISVSGREKDMVRIYFENRNNKKIGPFLSSHVTISPMNQTEMLSVFIGYFDKHKKAVLTHAFDYNVLNDVDKYAEARGDKTFLKTETQLHHDKSVSLKVNAVKSRLKNKYGR